MDKTHHGEGGRIVAKEDLAAFSAACITLQAHMFYYINVGRHARSVPPNLKQAGYHAAQRYFVI